VQPVGRVGNDSVNVSSNSRQAAKKANEKIASKEDRAIGDMMKRGKKRRKEKEDGRRSKKNANDQQKIEDNENWVQCELCLKWRLIPSVENLPDKWYCELNTTDLKRNSCDAPEQTAEEVAKERRKAKRAAARNSTKRGRSLSPSTVQPKKSRSSEKLSKEQVGSPEPVADKRKQNVNINSNAEKATLEQSRNSDSGDEFQIGSIRSKSRNTSRLSLNEDNSFENDISAEQSPTGQVQQRKVVSRRGGRQGNEEKGGRRRGKKPKEEKKQEWVLCERCEKWRRLPRHITAASLPDKWYCSMNTWDPRSASCAVQEDHIVEEEKARENTILNDNTQGTSTGGSKPSYRNLIKRPTRPISERMRAAESIFSSNAAEIEGEQSGAPPVVLYANSSVFQQKVGLHRMVESQGNVDRISLFALMNHSKLWKDLHNGFNPGSVTPSMVPSNPTTRLEDKENLTCSASMKSMIYDALGMNSMAVNEILLECQCGDWGDSAWDELRASCTYESVSCVINELVKDGLVEVLQGNPYDVFNLVRYKKSMTTRDADGETQSQNRPIKFSKPWKKARLGYT